MHMLPAEIGVKRRLDVAALSDLGEHVLKLRKALIHILRLDLVILPQLLHADYLLRHDLLVSGRIDPALHHSFFRFL